MEASGYWVVNVAVRADVDCFDDDREHPSLAGTYLAACVIAATIYGPAALARPRPYRPKNVAAGRASALRRAAAAAVGARGQGPT